ncbi:hypothetical protein OH146_07610 [Salinibacterium sp. SYSU T00001]|uniref:nitrilase-related carbon-nitrogen hydrolase n=1 Tax=Homoserinimonas sedimenticola TaxID=2986805 RepID=UPI0022369AD1|nr:nitrilase-related carbon-nitrogen hydrolase [Salinibacterium sedimenticola]MCW4385639.1 hypothetical protein [Salinibacterium sedimenticola]
MNDATPAADAPQGEDQAVTVAAVSTRVHIGEVERNLGEIREGIAAATAAGARLIVLPELATSGYVFADRAEAEESALDASSEALLAVVRGLDGSTVVVLGFCERAGDDLFNSAAVFAGGELLAVYRKSHLWGQERRIFTPGGDAGILVDTPVGRLGVAICYDNEFPEVPRRLALSGADILALPVNWPLVPRPESEHAPEIIQAMAAARSSRLPTVVADRHGEERGIPWTEGTVVIDGDGWIVAQGVSGVVTATFRVTPGDKRIGDYNDLFGDRRPTLY